MITIRNTYILVLTLLFCYCITLSLFNVLQEPTTFTEEKIEAKTAFPCLTLCTRSFWINDSYETIEDVSSAIQLMKDNRNITATLLHQGIGVVK